MNDTARFTVASATAYAHEWLKNRNDKAETQEGQFQWLLGELTSCSVAEAVRADDDDIGLDGKLYSAYGVLHALRNFGFPDDADKLRWKDSDDLSEGERKRLDQARRTVWKRRDPMISIKEGFNSPAYFSASVDEIYSELSEYLNLRWVRHPSVDWIFLDMMVTRELSAFGEEIKKTALPGKKGSLGWHDKYLVTRGNLAAMVTPTGLGRLIGPSRELTDPKSAFSQVMKVWECMYETWRCLSGPVINPSLVREEMLRSKAEGAVWDGPAWSLIDRVIEHDRSVWLVGPYR